MFYRGAAYNVIIFKMQGGIRPPPAPPADAHASDLSTTTNRPLVVCGVRAYTLKILRFGILGSDCSRKMLVVLCRH